MCSTCKGHWHVAINRSRKYWRPPGAAGMCNISGCARRCPIPCVGCRGGEWRQQRRGIIRVPTNVGFATTCMFCEIICCCTRDIALIACERLPIPQTCYAQWLLCTYAQPCAWDTPMGWRQQCSTPYVRGAIRICERRIGGNHNTVQEACGYEPDCVCHLCADIGGRACFGKLHLFVVWERPLWCGLWGFIWPSNRFCRWLQIVVRHRINPSAIGSSFVPFFFLQMTLGMMEHTFSNFYPATHHTPPLLNVSGVYSDHRIFIFIYMLTIRGASSCIYALPCHSPLGWEWFLGVHFGYLHISMFHACMEYMPFLNCMLFSPLHVSPSDWIPRKRYVVLYPSWSATTSMLWSYA